MRTTATLFLFTLAAGALAPAAEAQRYDDDRGYGGEVECRSRDKDYRECWTGFRGRVDLIRQTSKTTCIEGSNWGVRRGYVWVDRGCGGWFAEVRGGGGGWDGGGRPGHGGGGYDITCKSRDYRRTHCGADIGRGGVEIVDQLSDSPCREGRTWGWDRGGIWVDQGCEAVFRVRGR